MFWLAFYIPLDLIWRLHLGDELFWKRPYLLKSKTFLLDWHYLIITFHFKYLRHLKISSVTFILIARSQMRKIIMPLDINWLLAPTNNENFTLFYERKGRHKGTRANNTSNL